MVQAFRDGHHRKAAKVDNYELNYEQWRDEFLKMDQDELIERFGLGHDAKALYITYLAQRYRIDRATGNITMPDNPELIPYRYSCMAIYHLFHYAKPDAKVAGEFVTFEQIKRVQPFTAAFQKMVLAPFSRTFDDHVEEFKLAARRLGGVPIAQGDAGFAFPTFRQIPVAVTLWDSDEEFAARANVLFDAAANDFMHEETIVTIGSDVVRRMVEESGLEYVGPRTSLV